MNAIAKTLILLVLALSISATTALAYSGFPTYYPGNQYGVGARYYRGPWGEVMVYGAHGYFPNTNGYPPYGVRQYGHMYTVWDLRYGRTGW